LLGKKLKNGKKQKKPECLGYFPHEGEKRRRKRGGHNVFGLGNKEQRKIEGAYWSSGGRTEERKGGNGCSGSLGMTPRRGGNAIPAGLGVYLEKIQLKKGNQLGKKGVTS